MTARARITKLRAMSEDSLPQELRADVEAIGRIPAVPMILDVIHRTTGMGFVAVARVTEGRWVACAVRDAIGFGLLPGDELKVATTLCREVRERRAAVVISHVAEDTAFCDHPTPARYGFQSYISVPIVMPDGSFFGTLCAIDPQPRAIGTPDTLQALGLYAELIALHLDADQRLARSEATLLHERQTSELREQFIAVLGHDLRNPLMAVSAGTRMLARHPERAAEIAGHMERSIARMAGLIDNVMDFARGRLGGGLGLTLTTEGSLERTLMQVVQELQATSPERSIEVTLALEAPVRCDHARVAQLLSNLLGNALTHGDASEPVQVRASARGGAFTLSVSNAGPPIPPAAIARLFQPFFRAADRPSQEGLGLGLYIACEIARAHGGTLDVTSTPAATCFTFEMPAPSENPA